MSCKSVSELLPLFDDPELSSAERAAVATHLADCPVCARELESIRIARDTIASLRVADIPDHGPLHVLERVRTEDSVGMWQKLRRLFEAKVPVAGTLVACLLAVVVWSALPKPDAPSDTASPEAPMTFMFAQEEAAPMTTMRMMASESFVPDIVTVVGYSNDPEATVRRVLASLDHSTPDLVPTPTPLEGGGVQVGIDAVTLASVQEALLAMEANGDLIALDREAWSYGQDLERPVSVLLEIRPVGLLP